MSPLRTSLIRLAHQQPALRPHLLPLLTRTAAWDPSVMGIDPSELEDMDEDEIRHALFDVLSRAADILDQVPSVEPFKKALLRDEIAKIKASSDVIKKLARSIVTRM